MTTIGAGAVTYIVGPVTGAAIGASSDVIALSIGLAVTCAVDMIHGQWPTELDVHFISPVAAGLLWGVAHAVRPREARVSGPKGPTALTRD